MKLGKFVHIDWGDEPLLKLNRDQTVFVMAMFVAFFVMPAFYLLFPVVFARLVE